LPKYLPNSPTNIDANKGAKGAAEKICIICID